MKKLHFDYSMVIYYSFDVTGCCYTIKCIPRDTERQKISNLKIEMDPETVPEWAVDAHGNRYIFGNNKVPHSIFRFSISGDAECSDTSYEAGASATEEMIYRHSHSLTVPGEKLIEYSRTVAEKNPGFEGMTPLEKAKIIMASLASDYRYEKGETDHSTGAEEAFALGSGVCQDYAHIMISLLNLSGVSARYVTGLIIGEGESHAWVEVADQGKWYGFDPTHNTTVGDSYIKIGVGRNASECQINRGIMHGFVDQTQEIRVSVTEVSPGLNMIREGVLF